MADIRCRYCGTQNDAKECYCLSCGEKLPSGEAFTGPGGWEEPPEPRPTGRRQPRLADDLDISFRRSNREGDVMQAEKTARQRAAGILFAIGALQLVCGLVLVGFIGQVGPGKAMAPEERIGAAVMIVVLAVVYACLGGMAFVAPLVASIIGLVIYVLVFIADLAAAPEMAGRGIWLKIVFVVLLVQAIVVSNKARQARQEYEAEQARDGY
jgi:K+-sensing histidine kinase KdpD